MKREYLYRGKRPDTEKWVYGSLLQWKDGTCEICVENEDGILEKHTVFRDSVGQYTGLRDRNGLTMLFEGDVVKDNYGNIGVITYSDHFLNWRIVFHKARPDLIGEYGCHIFEWTYPENILEVIGSIHDNPDLLKETA